jgi:hypothetical protein
METQLTIDDIKNKVTTTYINSTNPADRIRELEECNILCDKLIEKKRIEYDNLSYMSKLWYLLHANRDIEKLKLFIDDCIIDQKLRPLW